MIEDLKNKVVLITGAGDGIVGVTPPRLAISVETLPNVPCSSRCVMRNAIGAAIIRAASEAASAKFWRDEMRMKKLLFG